MRTIKASSRLCGIATCVRRQRTIGCTAQVAWRSGSSLVLFLEVQMMMMKRPRHQQLQRMASNARGRHKRPQKSNEFSSIDTR